MTELKTLKDIEIDGDKPEPFILCADLRQEAIKWLKKVSRKKNNSTDPFSAGWYSGAWGWVKYFFNITEEELK